MNLLTPSPTRRKTGRDRGAYRPPSLDRSDNPFVRRRKLLRWVRSQRSISANLKVVIEALLDRILATSASLIGWDSRDSIAERTGLSKRSVDFAFAELKALGLGARLPASRLRAWLDAVGTGLGYSFPDAGGSHCWYTILWIHLPEDVANRARSCAIAGPSNRAQSGESVAQDSGGSIAQECALPLPIRESCPSESGPLNRQCNGSLDPGGRKMPEPERTQAGGRDEELAGLAELASGDDPIAARLARAALTPRMGPIVMAGPPKLPGAATGLPRPPGADAAAQIRAMTGHLARSSAVPPDLREPGQPPPRPIDPGSRIWEDVNGLAGAGPTAVEAVARALMRRFRDWNEITGLTFRKYLGLVSRGEFSADLVAGLVEDACRPGVSKPGRHLSKALAEEWARKKKPAAG